MKILVTGGCGFFGHHLVEHLIKNTDAEIAIIDKLTYASNGFDRLRNINCFDDKRVSIYTHDFTNEMPFGIQYELGKITHIVHCGAETHVDTSITDPLRFVRANVLGTAQMLQYARQLDSLEQFLYFSTDEVFGPAGTQWHEITANWRIEAKNLYHFAFYDEWDRYNSTNPYSATKAAGEELCLAWANTYKLPIIITHCMNLFGERQHPEKFIPNTIIKVLNGDTVTIHSDSSKERSGSRFYLHARNAADAVLFLLRHKPAVRDKFNIVGQREISNLELAKMIANMLNCLLQYEMVDFHSSRPGHDLRYALDGSKLVSLGWGHPLSLEESLGKTVKWFLEHPSWLGLPNNKREREVSYGF